MKYNSNSKLVFFNLTKQNQDKNQLRGTVKGGLYCP